MKTKRKDPAIVVRARVSKELRAEFMAVVEKNGDNASEIVRGAMEDYIDINNRLSKRK